MKRLNLIVDDNLIARMLAAKDGTGQGISTMIRRALHRYLTELGY